MVFKSYLFIFSEDHTYQFTLDNDSKKIAKDELHEIESDRAAAVQALRKWVLEQNAWLKAPIGNRKDNIFTAVLRHYRIIFFIFLNGIKYSIYAWRFINLTCLHPDEKVHATDRFYKMLIS